MWANKKQFKYDRNNHGFSRTSTLGQFDKTLMEHLQIIIIDQVTDANTEKLKEREAYWQSQLRTYTDYGGLNKRDIRLESSKSNTWNLLKYLVPFLLLHPWLLRACFLSFGSYYIHICTYPQLDFDPSRGLVLYIIISLLSYSISSSIFNCFNNILNYTYWC